MRVTVLVLEWNGASVLPACLASLDALDPPADEILVVDNAGTDGSGEWLRTHRQDRVRTLFLDENKGYAGGNNAGLETVETEIVALLNNDTEVDPGFIAAALRHFEDPSVGMVACKTLRHGQRDTIDKVGHLIYPDGMNRGRGTGEPDDGRFDAVEEALWPDGSGAFYRKSMLDEIGFLDERFFLYGEDAELGMRARWAGYRCIFEPGSIVYHHHSAGLGRYSPQKLYYIERNRLWLMAKTCPLSWLLLSPVTTTWRYLVNGWALLTGRGAAGAAGRASSKDAIAGAVLRAWWDGLRGMPGMLASRRSYPRQLSGRAMRALLRRHRITARALATRD